MVKNLPINAGDRGPIPGSGRSLGGGNGNLLQRSCLENPMGRGAWWAVVHRVGQIRCLLAAKPQQHDIFYLIKCFLNNLISQLWLVLLRFLSLTEFIEIIHHISENF